MVALHAATVTAAHHRNGNATVMFGVGMVVTSGVVMHSMELFAILPSLSNVTTAQGVQTMLTDVTDGVGVEIIATRRTAQVKPTNEN